MQELPHLNMLYVHLISLLFLFASWPAFVFLREYFLAQHLHSFDFFHDIFVIFSVFALEVFSLFTLKMTYFYIPFRI